MIRPIPHRQSRHNHVSVAYGLHLEEKVYVEIWPRIVNSLLESYFVNIKIFYDRVETRVQIVQ